MFKINVGRLYVSTIFEATIPSTPSCQSGCANNKNLEPSCTCCSAITNASSVICETISLRSWLKNSTCSAKNSASSSVSVINNSTASAASSKRPTAFKRGPITKPTVSSLISSLQPACFKIAFIDNGQC